MGYYGQFRGDYYQGDYYQGDPFFGFLGKLVKGGLGLVKGLTGIGGGGGMKPMSTAIERVQKVGPIVTGLLKKKGVRTALGGGAVLGAGAVLGRHALSGAGGRRRRRMNVCNPRALRRSIRRTQGFAKLAMRTIHLVHPKKKVRFGGFKKRTRKAA